MSEVVIRIVIDDEKLDAYADALYGGPPDDPAPPDNGKGLLKDWIEMCEVQLTEGPYIDTIWFEPTNSYVDSVTITKEDNNV